MNSTYSDIYTDITTGFLTSTISFKVVDSSSMSSIEEEAAATP